MNVAVFLPNWIGDVVMATPTLRALRRRIGLQGRLVGVMRPYVSQVLAGTTWLDEELFYDPKSKDAALGNRALVRNLRERELDAAILLTNSLRTGALAWFGRARRRYGYDRGLRGPLLTHRLVPPYAGRTWYGAKRFTPSPVLDYYLELAYAFGCDRESPRMELAISDDDRRAADRVWTTLGLPAPGLSDTGRRVIVFNSGGAFGAAKLWPNEYFAALARRVVETTDHSVLVLCGPAEREVAADIVNRAGHPRVVSLAGEKLSIGLSKACVARSRLMVTTDSGPRHFAAAFDVPVVSLFGPTHQEWSENHFERAVHLQKKLPCGPCQKRVCPLGTLACMRELGVDEVFDATMRLLAATGSRAAA
jgi:heptosyltransferase-2